MQIKIAENDPQSMSQDGDSILRSLQNKSLSLIDLVVRESLQNALDATIEGMKNTCVDFNIGDFNSDVLAANLDGITSKLQSRFFGQQRFMSISDKNTYGLDGEYLTTDNKELLKSNFFKLVFGIGKNQEKDGAGGSWGFGKTSYFRAGIGIVVYYTRIKKDDGFEERLIGSLIESPKIEPRLLDDDQGTRGIAWWGEMGSDRMIKPLVDHDEIESFLNIFNLHPYTGQETGTTIIIPYLNENILGEQDNGHKGDDPLFEHFLKTEIQTSVGRWYAARIDNPDYSVKTKNSTLKCRVNESEINEEDLPPVFKKFRLLYTSALTGSAKAENINVKPIYVPRTALENGSQIPIGHIAFGLVDEKEMKMGPPDYLRSPQEYVEGKREDNPNKESVSIIAYARKPGMVVQYSVDGKWFKGQLDEKKNTSLLGFFVPNSQGKLSEGYKKKGYYTLEQYLRASENADHAEWTDETGFTLINRIKKRVSASINEELNDNSKDEGSSVTSGISKKFGKLLLPPAGYGRSASDIRSKRRVKSNKNGGSKADVSVTSVTPVSPNEVMVYFKVTLKPETKSIISLKLKSQASAPISKKDWGENSKFPFTIVNVQMDSEGNLVEQEAEYRNALFYLTSHSDKNATFEGRAIIQIDSKDYVPFFAISQ